MFVLSSYKNGGALGYDEWCIIGICSTQEKAEQMKTKFLTNRLDKRFDCTIQQMEIDQIDAYFYQDKRFTLRK